MMGCCCPQGLALFTDRSQNAAHYAHLNACKALLDAGADPDLPDAAMNKLVYTYINMH